MTMARGQKTSPEVIYKVMVSWAITGNYSETAKELSMPVSTVKKVVDDNKDRPEFEKLCKLKRDEFIERATRVMNKALDRIEEIIDDKERDVPLNQLSNTFGTLYDKRALAQGNATENVKVDIKLPEGIEEYAG